MICASLILHCYLSSFYLLHETTIEVMGEWQGSTSLTSGLHLVYFLYEVYLLSNWSLGDWGLWELVWDLGGGAFDHSLANSAHA